MSIRREASASRSLGLAMLLGALAASSVLADPSREWQRYLEMQDRGVELMEAGKFARSEKVFLALTEKHPEIPEPWYNVACVRALAGNTAGALDALDRIVDRGFTDQELLRTDPDLDAIRDHPRFAELLVGVENARQAWLKRLVTTHGDIDADRARSFKDVQSILSNLDERLEKHGTNGGLKGWRKQADREWALYDETLAALERYLADHPLASDREDARWETLRVAGAYKPDWHCWGGDAALVGRYAREYLNEFPEGPHAAEARLARALSEWKACTNDDRHASLQKRAEAALPALDETVNLGGNPSAVGLARVHRVRIHYELAGNRVDPKTDYLIAELLEIHRDDPAVAEKAWKIAAPALFQFKAGRAFTATDLDGRRWTMEAMKGQVTFARYGVCQEEYRKMRSFRDAHADRGFEILGVLLDHEPKEAVLAKLENAGVNWPVIHDGMDGGGDLGRAFRTTPRGFLVDREGHVVAHGKFTAAEVQRALESMFPDR